MNLQGFKRIKEIPSCCRRRAGQSKWDDVISTVIKDDCILMHDTGDKRRSKSIANSIRIRSKKIGAPIMVTQQETVIYVSKRREQ